VSCTFDVVERWRALLTCSMVDQIALHGTDELPDQLWKDCVKAGARKVRLHSEQDSTRAFPDFFFLIYQFNINSWARDPTMARIASGLAKDEPLPDIYEAATEVYAGVCEKFFDLLGSRGRA
jgi:fructose-bisphosphate aldolase, class II